MHKLLEWIGGKMGEAITRLWETWATPQDLMKAARAHQEPHERGQTAKRQTRYDYTQGPMHFIGQQIVKAMQDAGYPAKIAETYRSNERQDELFLKRPKVTNAWAGASPHQFYEATDIIHPSKGWDVSSDYWETLARCVRIVADRYGVELEHGHNWRFVDSAHIELKDWRKVRPRYQVGDPQEVYFPYREPTPEELARRFKEVLPQVWAQHQKSKAA